MATEFVQPYNGPLIIDVQSKASIVKDLKRGAKKGLRTQKEGFSEVVG